MTAGGCSFAELGCPQGAISIENRIFRILIAIPTFMPRNGLDPRMHLAALLGRILSAGGKVHDALWVIILLSDYRHSVRSRMLKVGVHIFSME